MDIKEKRKQYYIDNKERIKTKNKKYYHDNKAERQIYNREYWALHGHKYVQQRSEDTVYKANQRLYFAKNREGKKHIYTVDCINKNLQDIKLQDLDKKQQDKIILVFKFSF